MLLNKILRDNENNKILHSQLVFIHLKVKSQLHACKSYIKEDSILIFSNLLGTAITGRCAHTDKVKDGLFPFHTLT